MNTWQIMNQVRFKLQEQNWTGGSTPVFRASHIFIAAASESEILDIMGRKGSPLCIIVPGTAQTDPEKREEADFISLDFGVIVLVKQANGPVGEAPIMGGNRKSRTDTLGRGILEIEEEVFNAIELLQTQNGIKTQLTGASEVGLTQTEVGYVTHRDYTFQAKITKSRFYEQPGFITAVDNGGGSVTLSWTLAPRRYDSFEQVLRRATGATPPSSPTAGTGVTLATPATDTSVTDTPGAGTFSYALFQGYNDFGSLTNEQFSDGRNKASVVVT